MGFLSDLLTGALGPFGPIIAVGTLGIFLILITLVLLINQPVDPMDKLKKSLQSAQPATPQHQRLRSGGKNETLDKYAGFLEPQDEEQLSAIRKKLMQAGYRDRDA